MLHAVITGDVVNSTLLPAPDEQRLLKALEDILSPYIFEFYRGDSFQAYIEDPYQALDIALLCRTAAIGMGSGELKAPPDLRMSIGIGTVSQPVEPLGLAKGEAFLLSGRALDRMEKTERRFLLVAADKMPALALLLVADYLDLIYRGMTAKQAEVILELLKGNNQQQAADILNKSKSTISQHVTAGKWDEIEKVLDHYKKLIELISA